MLITGVRVYRWELNRYPSPNWYLLGEGGDTRFSDKKARLQDGRTIREAFNLDVKGYRLFSNHWRYGEGRPCLTPMNDDQLYMAYLNLWHEWGYENPYLIAKLQHRCEGKYKLTYRGVDIYNPARALCDSLNRVLR